MIANGRRVRGSRKVTKNQINKFNKQIQKMNDESAEARRIVSGVERTVRPNDYLSNRITDDNLYLTWRTVGSLNITDHFIRRYLERIMNVSFDRKVYEDVLGYYNESTLDKLFVMVAERVGKLDENVQRQLVECVKNPPEHLRLVRDGCRVVTVLTFAGQEA